MGRPRSRGGGGVFPVRQPPADVPGEEGRWGCSPVDGARPFFGLAEVLEGETATGCHGGKVSRTFNQGSNVVPKPYGDSIAAVHLNSEGRGGPLTTDPPPGVGVALGCERCGSGCFFLNSCSLCRG